MKKRVWTAMPVYLIFVAVMALLTLPLLKYNKVLFYIGLVVTIIALVAVLIMTLSFREYVKKVVNSVTKAMTKVPDDYLETLKLAAAVVGDHGEILLYNRKFKDLFFKNVDGLNENISKFLVDETIDTLTMSVGGVDTEFEGKQLTVYSSKVSRGYLLTVVDNTYLRNIEKDYFDTKKSVALVVFDNLDDFMSNSEEDASRAMLTVENLLSRWAQKHESLFRKLSDGKYLIIFDEIILRKQVEKKFRILDKIRQNTISDRATTISIGIGRSCKTLKDSHANAKKALDMALGRGGDQVAILSDGEYEFFGGVSKGVEKTSRVRVRVVAQSIQNSINQCDNVLIMGHKFSDLDCVGAAAGVYSAVTKAFSKRAYIVVDEEKSMAKSLIEHLESKTNGMFVTVERALSLINDRTLLFIVDTHSPDFVESPKVWKLCRNVIVIDHHRKMVNFIDNADVFFHEPNASSTSEMVTELIGYLGDDGLSRPEAEGLLSGIMLDTKNFVINTGVRTFEAAAYLRKKGADTVTVRNMFANSIDTYKEKYEVVSRAKIVNNCAISTINGIVKNSRLLSAMAADEMLTIRDVYASFVISQIDAKNINISARSYGKINVQLVMEKLGGGGHQNMAAVQLADTTMEQAAEKLIEAIRSY